MIKITEENMFLTCVTRGVRRVAEFLPKQRMAKRIHRQQRSIILTSAWYFVQACDKTGQSWKQKAGMMMFSLCTFIFTCEHVITDTDRHTSDDTTYFTLDNVHQCLKL